MGKLYMQDQVFGSMNRADDNGYDQIYVNTPKEIAYDIVAYDSAFEGINPELIIPAVIKWREAAKKAGYPKRSLDVHGGKI